MIILLLEKIYELIGDFQLLSRLKEEIFFLIREQMGIFYFPI